MQGVLRMISMVGVGVTSTSTSIILGTREGFDPIFFPCIRFPSHSYLSFNLTSRTYQILLCFVQMIDGINSRKNPSYIIDIAISSAKYSFQQPDSMSFRMPHIHPFRASIISLKSPSLHAMMHQIVKSSKPVGKICARKQRVSSTKFRSRTSNPDH